MATIIALSANKLYLKKDSTLSSFNRIKSDLYEDGYKAVINDKYDADMIMDNMYIKDEFQKYNKEQLEEFGIDVYDW